MEPTEDQIDSDEHLEAMPEGYRIMEVGETITAGCLYWTFAKRWSQYALSPGSVEGEVGRDHWHMCCPVDSQKQPEMSDNSDRGGQVSDNVTTCGCFCKSVTVGDKTHEERTYCDKHKPVQDQVKMKLHEYECRAKNAEDEVVELQRKLDCAVQTQSVLSGEAIQQRARIDKLENERDEAKREAYEIETKRQRLVFEYGELRDAVKRLERANHHQQKNLDKFEKELQHEKECHEVTVNTWQAFESATKGHTLENIKTIMEAMPPAKDLEGYELHLLPLQKGDDHWNEVDHEWTVQRKEVEANIPVVAWIRTPIIEYIPTEEITDALCEELGRIECEVCSNCNKEVGWIPSVLIQVESSVDYAYETVAAGKHRVRWWNQCRIKKSDLISAEKRTNKNNTTEGSPNE